MRLHPLVSRVLGSMFVVSLLGSADAQSLSTYAMNQGFTLGPWGFGFANDGGSPAIGPLGILPRLDGKVLVANYFEGTVRLFALNTPLFDPTGQPASNGVVMYRASPAASNACGLAAVVSGGSTRYFLTQQGLGKVIELTADGVYLQDIAAVPGATGICAFPPGAFFMGTSAHLGKLFVSAPGGIWEIDPTTPGAAPVNFTTTTADGFGFTNSGHYLLTNSFAVIDVLTKAVVYSVPLTGGPDGLAIGRGPITGGKAYVNRNDGSVVEIVYDQSPGSGLELDPPTPPVVNTIMSGGTRGDFIAVDPVVLSGGPVTYWPSLLLSQSDSILRLDPPNSGWFGPPFSMDPSGGPVSELCIPGVGGVIACPCANAPGGPGRGCNNSSSTGGARIDWAGVPSLAADSLLLSVSEEKPTATSIFLQGTTVTSGAVFGQGVRCTSGQLKRLFVKNASAGMTSAPMGADPSISARSASLGDPLSPGSVRYYQTYYRDPQVLGGCPSANTFNVTQALRCTWAP